MSDYSQEIAVEELEQVLVWWKAETTKLRNEVAGLKSENTLMNELVSDQKREIEKLKEQVNRLAAVLVKMGMSPSDINNILET